MSLTYLLMSTESSVQWAFIQPIARHLREQGHSVTLCCSEESGEAGHSFVDQLQQEGFPVFVLPMQRTISPWADLKAIITLYRYLRRHRVDVLHTQTAKAGFIGRLAAWLARVPVVVYTAHAWPFHAYLPPWKQDGYAWLERLAARWCQRIVVDSYAVEERGLQFKVAPASKIRVIPLGVDTNRFAPRAVAHPLTVGCVTRLVEDKGLDLFLRTVALLRAQFPSLRVLIVGDGPLRAHVLELSDQLGLWPGPVLVGYSTDVPMWLAQMDVFLLPSKREGFGVAYAEAMAMEVPVVALDIPPLNELIVLGTGVLVSLMEDAEGGSAWQVRALAHAVQELLQDADHRRALGRAARQRVCQYFTHTRMVEAHRTLYEHLYAA